MKRHKCTSCRKKRLEKFLRTVRGSDKPNSWVWICKDNCSDGRINNVAQSYLNKRQSLLQEGQSHGSRGLSVTDLEKSNVPGGKYILDVCCGERSFWFDKNNKLTIFADIKSDVDTNIVQDFRDIKFKDKSFKLVVFDPPHIFKKDGVYSWINRKYGTLSIDEWPMDIMKGFEECYRVLEDFGVLIFKWSESSISVSTILTLCPIKPLFGHTSDKKNRTHWLCFMKIPGDKK